jgi:hypothetical protein
MKHYLSDSGIWRIIAEFVDPDGRVMYSEGESVVWVGDTETTNDVWVSSKEINRRNSYSITTNAADGCMEVKSINPDLPQLKGTFNVDCNILHFKYEMEGTTANGHEIITRKSNTCYVYGAHYEGTELVLTWTGMMNKKKMQKPQSINKLK